MEESRSEGRKKERTTGNCDERGRWEVASVGGREWKKREEVLFGIKKERGGGRDGGVGRKKEEGKKRRGREREPLRDIAGKKWKTGSLGGRKKKERR